MLARVPVPLLLLYMICLENPAWFYPRLGFVI
jgi:hypothetical protein